MLPATPHAALVRLAICIGPPTHTGISPSPFPSHIAAIPNIYTFFFCLIIFQQQPLLLSHNLLNCLCHSFLSDLPLFCSLLLPDRIPTITVGVLFFLIGSSLFCTTRPASGFRETKRPPDTVSEGLPFLLNFRLGKDHFRLIGYRLADAFFSA